MPGVDIYCTGEVRAHLKFPEMRQSIKDSVRRIGAAHLSTDEWPLGESDFSIKFHHPEDGDELTNDIIVRIRLHAFEERLAKVSDEMAATIAAYLVDDLAKYFPGRIISLGVELMLAEVRWGTARAAD